MGLRAQWNNPFAHKVVLALAQGPGYQAGMARPKLVSDDEVLDATHAAMLRLGPDRFTLADVARDLGLSRAALIQRFGDKHALHVRAMARATDEVRAYFAAAPRETGLAPLWVMLRDLIAGMGEGQGFSGYLLLLWADAGDPALNRLARERNLLVRNAIAERLPDDHARAANAGLIQDVIQGATMRWLVERDGGLDAFVMAETRLVLSRLYPGVPLE